MPVRGIRGAINVASNSKEEILSKSRELLEAMSMPTDPIEQLNVQA